MKTGIPGWWIIEQRNAEDKICMQILRENIASCNVEIKKLNGYCKEHKEDRFAKIRLGSLQKTRREMKRQLKTFESGIA